MRACPAFWTVAKKDPITTKLVPLLASTSCIVFGFLLTPASTEEIMRAFGYGTTPQTEWNGE